MWRPVLSIACMIACSSDPNVGAECQVDDDCDDGLRCLYVHYCTKYCDGRPSLGALVAAAPRLSEAGRLYVRITAVAKGYPYSMAWSATSSSKTCDVSWRATSMWRPHAVQSTASESPAISSRPRRTTWPGS